MLPGTALPSTSRKSHRNRFCKIICGFAAKRSIFSLTTPENKLFSLLETEVDAHDKVVEEKKGNASTLHSRENFRCPQKQTFYDEKKKPHQM
jgi:hypothetical protein